MAIDKNKTEDLIEEIDRIFNAVMGGLPNPARSFMKNSIMGPAMEEIKQLINESRPPVLFLMGRSGHGKSSVINALANKYVAEVGDIKPTTPDTIPYEITFPERYATWQVVDSRGIFESTKPDGAVADDAMALLEEDIVKYQPDVIMHVVSAPEIRNLGNDLKAFRNIYNKLSRATGVAVPAVIVVNKADTLGNPREWPPEENAKKAALIKDSLEYLAKEVLNVRERKHIDLNYPIKGSITRDDIYIGIIPTCSLEGEHWNIETLSLFIGENIPLNTILNFYQAQNRRNCLRQVSSQIIKRFAKIAGGIGAAPVPIADIALLTPLQLLMIAIIGGLSCREFKKETAKEYLAAAGLNVGAALGLRTVAHQLVRLIPFGGWAVSGAIASSATYALGKSAEAYFFAGELKKPELFKDEFSG